METNKDMKIEIEINRKIEKALGKEETEMEMDMLIQSMNFLTKFLSGLILMETVLEMNPMVI